MRALALALLLTACVPATSTLMPFAVVGTIGVADVVAFRGCIGVQASNQLPMYWNNPYACVPVRYVSPDAPQGWKQIIAGFEDK